MSAAETPGYYFAPAGGLRRSLEKYFARAIFTLDKHTKVHDVARRAEARRGAARVREMRRQRGRYDTGSNNLRYRERLITHAAPRFYTERKNRPTPSPSHTTPHRATLLFCIPTRNIRTEGARGAIPRTYCKNLRNSGDAATRTLTSDGPNKGCLSQIP